MQRRDTSKPPGNFGLGLKHLTLTGVKLSDNVLGSGTSGTVYKADYNGTPCAAKRIDPLRLRFMHTKDYHYFVQECLRHSQLEHRNIVKMLGVSYYHDSEASDSSQVAPEPVLIMELMEYTLEQLMKDDESLFIPMYVKLSILQDVSAGLCYLHNLNPPLAHGGLVSENVLLTSDLVAKVGDFGDAKVVHTKSGSHQSETDSIPWVGSAFGSSFYDQLPRDVLNFGHLAYHVITQKRSDWRNHRRYHISILRILEYGYDDGETLSMCCDDMSEGPLKQLVELCLNRYTQISVIHEQIIEIKRG